MRLPFKSYYHGLTSAVLLSFSPLIPVQSHAGAPRVLATTPAAGATEVDVATAEITVTFDQDMADGIVWVGGGPEFPPIAEGKQPYWRDRRTCVLPVKLEPGHFYRVEINSAQFHEFRNEQGVPVRPSAIYFTTGGGGLELTRRVVLAEVTRSDPEPDPGGS